MLTTVTSEDQFSELTSKAPASQLLVVYFQTPWAAPCVQMAKVVETLAEANPQHQFLVVDADSMTGITELFEVASVPHFVLIRDLTILKEVSGADPKEIAAAISEFGSAQKTEQTPQAPVAASKTEPAKTPEESPEELNQRLEKLTNAAPIMVFIKGTPSEPKCGFSRQLIAILREHQVKFGFFDILKDNSVRQGLKTFSDWPTFPQLYINGEFQGGLDIVKENLEEDPDFFENALKA